MVARQFFSWCCRFERRYNINYYIIVKHLSLISRWFIVGDHAVMERPRRKPLTRSIYVYNIITMYVIHALYNHYYNMIIYYNTIIIYNNIIIYIASASLLMHVSTSNDSIWTSDAGIPITIMCSIMLFYIVFFFLLFLGAFGARYYYYCNIVITTAAAAAVLR